MAVKLVSTETIYKVNVTTKLTFVDEYDHDLSCMPTVARVYVRNGKLDKIELDGDDESGFLSDGIILRDLARMSGRQAALIRKIRAACGV
jgi:hypothetical protein